MDREMGPVIRAVTDREILVALQGVKVAQSDIQTAIREGRSASMTLAFLAGYMCKLPDEVATRLSEVRAEDLADIPEATGRALTGAALEWLAGRLAGEAARAQVIRAANAYRAKLGLVPLGPDGWPEEMDHANDDHHH